MVVDFDCRLDARTGVLTLTGVLDADTTAALARLEVRGVGIRMIDARRVELLAAAGVTALLEIVDRRPTPVQASAAARRTIECCGVADTLVISPVRG